MFICPAFVPPTLEELTQEIDEVTVLVKREAQLNKELDDIQKYNKDAVPLGVVRVGAEVEEEGDDDDDDDDDDDEEDDDELDSPEPPSEEEGMASQVESIKRVPGTPFVVDGFRFQGPHCRHYFLTHAHSDHTTGLTRGFCSGVIYCTPVTAAVVRLDIGLPPGRLHPLALDETVTICGVEVTPLDANHCPGACMFLFKVPPPEGVRGEAQVILHTGDLRWHPRMAAHPALAAAGRLHTLILDTTYCAPKWVFPPQEEAVALVVSLMRREAAACPATLFVMGSYHIGKERAYLGAAHQLGWRVHCPPAKRKLLRVLGLPEEWLGLLTEDPQEAQIHVLGMGEQLHEQALANRIKGTRWERVVAIRPTGWTFRKSGGASIRVAGPVTTMGVPYSEHSSFEELRDCVRALRPRRIIPTVNATDPAKARALVDLLADCMDLSSDRSRLDSYFQRRSQHSMPSAAAGQQGGPSACQLPQKGPPPPAALAAAAAAVQAGRCAARQPPVVWVNFGAPSPHSLAPVVAAAPQAAVLEAEAAGERLEEAWPAAAPAECPLATAMGAAVGQEGAVPLEAAGPLEAGGPQQLAQPEARPQQGPACGAAEPPAATAGAAGGSGGGSSGRRGPEGISFTPLGSAQPEQPPRAATLRRCGSAAGSVGPESSWDLEIDLGSEEPPWGGEGMDMESPPPRRGQGWVRPGDAGTPAPAGAGGGGCSQGRQRGPPQEGQSGTEGGEACEEDELDLSQVDIAQQERILAAIAQERARAARPPGSGGQLRQGSMRAFLAPQRS